jgi:uncharacterized membrane protein SpoIIM required for sporulation/uncharacterized RDD family membrane protein YckC
MGWTALARPGRGGRAVARGGADADIAGSAHVVNEELMEPASPGPTRSASYTQVTRGYDQVVDVETPEQVVFSYTVAGIGSRAAAALTDHALIAGSILLFGLIYVFVLAPVLGTGGASALAQQTGAWLLAVLLLLQFVVQWGYYVLFEALWDGQTPGKRWLGLRVVQDGGYSVSFAASAARNIARILDMQPVLVYLVGLICVAFSKTGKRAGDQLAGTIVVRERILSRPPSPSPAETLPGRAPVTAALDENEMEVLHRFLARADAIDVERRAALAARLANRLRPHLPDAPDETTALQLLYERERAARAQGVSGRGETGAARERYALMAEGEARWNRFAARLANAQRRGLARMSADEVASFVADYREIATDLARLQTAARGREPDALFRLSRLVAGGHNLLYRQERVAARATARFFFVTVPAEIRRSAVSILAAALLLFGSGAVAYIGVVRNPTLAEALVPPGMIDRAEVDAARARAGDATYIDVEDYARPLIASTVFRNNVQVTFLAFASGLTAGIATVLLLLANGISIGAAIGLFATKGIGHLIIGFVTAHGVFELTAICIAAGGGFRIASAILLPGVRTRREALVLEGRRALRLLAAATVFLAFAGAIEGLISPRTDIGFGVRIAVAVVSALLIAAYLTLGRGRVAAERTEAMAYSEDLALIAR